MRRQVSEKTLELNVVGELLAIIRGFPGCGSAFWIGMKQDQEARTGIDELIYNVPNGLHLALQFKSPKPLPRNLTPYRFTINDSQNSNLLRLALGRPNAVYYIFPHYNTLSALKASAPTLLVSTWFMRVFDLRNLAASTRRNGLHLVESDNGTAVVHSQPFMVSTVEGKKLLLNLFDKQAFQRDMLLTHAHLKDWLKNSFSQVKANRYMIGQLLRGFGTICIS